MEVFERRASQNKYLHRDFHISMNMLMEYIRERFGPESLTEYLREFSREFHKVRKEELTKGSLIVLYDYFKKIYKDEEWEIEITVDESELRLYQTACPGILHIRKNGFSPVEQYIETYTTVYDELCKGTPFEYIMMDFAKETGACTQVFRRRAG